MNWPADRPAGHFTPPDPAAAALRRALGALEEELSRLVLALEDRPPGEAPALVDHFDNAATDRLGELAAARDAEARFAAARSDARHAALAAVQEGVNELHRRYGRELAAFDRLRSLQRLGRERGGEWSGWARAVRMAIESCAPALDDAHGALLACWRDLGARTGGTVFVGQPVILPDARHPFGTEPTRP